MRWLLAAALLFAAHDAAAGTHALLVPVKTIYPGEAVTAVAMAEKLYTLDDALLSNWVTAAQQVRGKQARRTLAAGKPIALTALKTPDAVLRGRPARATYRAPGLEIATTLVPLDDAAAGEQVSARNPETGIVVEAEVLANGELLVEAR
jgi:flagellar basal body P-ring formation protein FlgA